MGLLTSLPRWATDGSAQITEPSSGKKDTGWVPAEKPPAQYMNWLFKTIYNAAVVLDGLAGIAMTWTAAHVFNAGLSASSAAFTGAITVQTPTVAANPLRFDSVLGVANLPALNRVASSDSGSFYTTSATLVDVTNLSVSITTRGRPVMIAVTPSGAINGSTILVDGTATTQNTISITRDGTTVAVMTVGYGANIPAILMFDSQAAGTYVYKLRASGTSGIGVYYCKLSVIEL